MSGRELLSPALVDGIARIARAINGMTEAHYLRFFGKQLAQTGGGLLRTREFFDQFHRRLVGAAVQRSAQRANRAGDARIEIGKCGCTDPSGEGRSIELMLGVKDERRVHRAPLFWRRRASPDERQRVAGDGVVADRRIDAHAFVREAIPVGHDRGQAGEEALRDVMLLRETRLRLEISEHGNARAHGVHRMRGFRDLFEHVLEHIGQRAQFAEPRLEGREFRRGGQCAVEQQVGDFLEGGMFREVLDAVAAISQAVAFLAHRGDGGFAGGNTAQAAGSCWFGVGHGEES